MQQEVSIVPAPPPSSRRVQALARELVETLEALVRDECPHEPRRGDLRLACALTHNVLDLVAERGEVLGDP